MNIQITIDNKKVKAVKKLLDLTDLQDIIQKVADNQIDHIIRTKYQEKKRLEDIVDELQT